MRYFICTSASRPYTAGGLTFTFEPIGPRGGSWLGVLAVDDSAASVLAASGIPQIDEISEERYTDEKKKLNALSESSIHSTLPPPMGNPLIQSAVGAAASPTVPGQAGSQVVSETLETTDQQPPTDPAIEEQNRVKKRVPKQE